ncbi:MAG: alkaline phosphatase family protein [Candidatus Njordarchaeia archaeon]
MKKRLILLSAILVILLMVPLVQSKQEIVAEELTQPVLGKLGVIVIFDACNYSVLDSVSTPNIDTLISQGIYVIGDTILPSATTAAHTALAVGAYPETTGVTHTYAYNSTEYHEQLLDETPAKKYYSDMLKAKTIFEVAKDNYVKTALIVSKSKLDVMLGSGGADIFEVLPDSIVEPGDPHDASYPLEKRYTAMEWITNESLKAIDQFAISIKEGENALLLIHYAEPDWVGSALGPDSSEYRQLIQFLDGEIGRIYNKLVDTGLWSKTLFFLTADHGLTAVDPLKDILTGDPSHLSVLDVEHFVSETAGLLLHIYLKYPEKDTHRAVEILKSYPWTKGVYTRVNDSLADGTLDAIHLNTEFAGDIVLDVKAPYYASKYEGALGAHGGTDTIKIPVIITGGAFKAGSTVADCKIVDIAPTLAEYLGFDLPDSTGSVLNVFKKLGTASLSVSPGIIEPGQSFVVQFNYTLQEIEEGMVAKILLLNESGAILENYTVQISTSNGTIEHEFKLTVEGTFYILGAIYDSEGYPLCGSKSRVLSVEVSEPPTPWDKIAVAVVISVFLGAALVVLPYFFKRYKILFK